MGQTTGQGSIGLSQKPSGSAGGVTDLENGLYKDGTIGKLGGALVENTTIDGTGFEFKLVADEGTFFYANLQNGSADPYAVIMGDISNLVTGLKLGVFSGDNYIAALDESANFLFIIDPGQQRYGIGDMNLADNGTYLLIDDDGQTIEISNVAFGNTNDDYLTLDEDDIIRKVPAPVINDSLPSLLYNTTNVNIPGSSTSILHCTRVLDQIVHCFGYVQIDHVAAGLTYWEIDLPVPTTMATGGDCAGTYCGYEVTGPSSVPGQVMNAGTRASFQHYWPNAGGSCEFYFHFSYRVINP